MTWKSNPYTRKRRPAREVLVGDVGVGGRHPIRVQSMTTTPTANVAATTAQIRRLVEAGCEIVRVTVPKTADADALPAIRRALEADRVGVPLVADIHFTPAIALRAVEHVEKVRVNPGNFADKKRFAVREYDDRTYARELERVEARFRPLVRRCRERGVALRIGTNHGSLSDRIINRFGDTPEGMVESALEFVRMCELHDHRALILSMKSSNPVIVLRAYRLLVARMDEEGMDYPLHLGVTEAGDGQDARIKSAIGIGALLDDGIGDTVRVSLTEDPVAEIPVARALVAPYDALGPDREIGPVTLDPAPPDPRDPILAAPRRSRSTTVGPVRIGADAPTAVEVPVLARPSEPEAVRAEIDLQAGARVAEDVRADVVSIDVLDRADIAHLPGLRRTVETSAPRLALSARPAPGLVRPEDGATLDALAAGCHRVHWTLDAGDGDAIDAIARACLAHGTALLIEAGAADRDADRATAAAVEAVRVAASAGLSDLMTAVDPRTAPSPYACGRLLTARLTEAGLDVPIVAIDRPAERQADPLLGPSSCLGGLLCDGTGDAVQIARESPDASRRLAFGLLQAARVRITRTEYISCPSCGRTLFDLERTTARIKARTAHLKGLKIGVMGCIVNGPGEMADADFGYVGWGEDKIALFVGKEMVEKDIPTDEADQRLIDLIKTHGRWVDPPVPTADD